MLSRNELAAAALDLKLSVAKVGVVVLGQITNEPEWIIQQIAEQRAKPIYAVLVGHASKPHVPNASLAYEVETAVHWRNTPELAGHIVVFVPEEVEKLHSLADLDTLSPRDLTLTLLDWARGSLSRNQVQTRAWDALKKLAETLPLTMAEAFVTGVEVDHHGDAENELAISDNLWRLGLLADPRLLHPSADPDDRLRLNRALMMEVSQLSEASRRRIAAALRANPDDQQLRQAYSALQAFNRYGRREDLRPLSIKTVEGLIRVSRPKPTTASPNPTHPKPQAAINENNGEVDSAGDTTESPGVLDEGETAATIGRFAIDPSGDSEAALSTLLEALREHADGPSSERQEVNLADAFDGATLRLARSDVDLRRLIGTCCSAEAWGGVLESPHGELRDIKNRFTPDQIQPFDPTAPSQNLGGMSLTQLLERVDADMIEISGGDSFNDTFARVAEHRARLAEDLDLLLEHPVALLGGSREARDALNNYLDAYGTLLRLFHTYETALAAKKHGQATTLIAAELIRLDVLHVRTPDEWKAILTPLHPLHLWRYRQMFDFVHNERQRRTLDATDEEQLIEALHESRGVLPFLPLSQSVIGMNQKTLPLAGRLGPLPTYENDTNRYLGPDGVEFLSDLLRRWITDAPYSRTQVRLALVDVPDTTRALAELRKFLVGTADSRVICDLYVTRDHDTEGELARLDYEGQDHEIAELLRTRRLALKLQRLDSLAAVAERLGERPVHVAFFFDQSQYRVVHAPGSKVLHVSPLVVVYDYDYDKTLRRGEIVPSTQSDQGLFSDFDYVVSRATASPAGQQQRLRQASGADLEPINQLLEEGRARWLVIADRVLIPYHPRAAVPLAETLRGQREIGVWARDRSQSVRQYVNLLKGYNLAPDHETIAGLLRRFGHVATSGMLGLPTPRGGSGTSDQSRRKGLVGAVLAAAWYQSIHPEALVASLDSPLGQRWLQHRSASMERADLVGLHMEDDRLVVEAIEVKALETVSSTVRIAAMDQLAATIRLLRPIFGGPGSDCMFTPARREILKYQLFRECFRQVHRGEWQERWFELLNAAFSLGGPQLQVSVSGLIVHVNPEESGSGAETSARGAEGIRFVRLGQLAIQKLVRKHASARMIPLEATDPTSAMNLGRAGNEDKSPMEVPASVEHNPSADIGSVGSASREGSLAPIPIDMPSPAMTTSLDIEARDIEVSVEDAEEIARRFRRASKAFGIEVFECDPDRAVAGPTVLRLYVQLRPGQRLSELVANLDDIGRQMSRTGLLVSPVPNSSEIALDVPRMQRMIVPLQEGLAGLGDLSSPEEMPIALGVTPEGAPIIPDLSKLPHLLVGGTTGAGKTMLLFSVLTSLLIKHRDPSTLRLFLSTSKPEDFVFFEGLPHLEPAGVVDDAGRAVTLLRERIGHIFDERGVILKSARCRDIAEYNRLHPTGALPPWVVVVDELADLADQLEGDRVAKSAFYANLRRIAQLGRNRGVHLVLCTQRPSADLVPTSIRNLMNARVALKVNDATASRMILDEPGAQQLQLHGDFLFKEQSTVVRGQGYYVDSQGLDALVGDLRR